MNAATRLGLYGAGLVVLFGAAFTTADVVIPDSVVDSWGQSADHDSAGNHSSEQDAHGEHGTSSAVEDPADDVRGVTSAQAGHLLGPVTAPSRVGEAGALSFRILDARGKGVTRYVTEHDRKLHLIVVRVDGTRFRHVHPRMDASGTWSVPWTWAAPGTYRVYADFVPEGKGALTLTRTVEVGGVVTPVPASRTRTASVAGFTVDLTGDLVAGTSSELSLRVSRDGRPVTALQPYLGAFGHLVALRQGDLAYLHVHPEGEEPAAGELSGPDIEFAAEVPTPGRYLLYLDFRVDGRVHTAPFVLDTSAAAAEPGDGHGH